MDLFGVAFCSLPSEGCCGDWPGRDERELRLLRRGDGADWRKANDEEGRRPEYGVGEAVFEVGV